MAADVIADELLCAFVAGLDNNHETQNTEKIENMSRLEFTADTGCGATTGSVEGRHLGGTMVIRLSSTRSRFQLQKSGK